MTGYGFFRSLQYLVGLGLIVVVALGVFAAAIYFELSREATFRHNYGTNWRAEYEQVYGPLTKAHARVSLSAIGLVSISSVTIWLYRLLRPNHRRKPSNQRRNRVAHAYRSPLERAIVYRRNGILGVVFGVAGIALSILLVLFRLGIFADHSDEVVLGIFVFLAGYCGVIGGCSFWLRAKAWNEAIVFIGLMPLVIFLIPFVRLIFLVTPGLLPVSMVMMPLILVVVVLTLPDRSGAPRRKRWWGKDAPTWKITTNQD